MLASNPYDANNGYFRFNSDNTSIAPSAFSFNYRPDIINAYAANPNANIPGGINPTANKLASLQPQDSGNQESSPTMLQNPKLINYSDWVSQQNQMGQGSEGGKTSGLNSNTSNLLSSAGKQLLPGITSTIDNFGMGLGFGSGGGAAEAISPALAAADPSLAAAGATISEGAASAGSLTAASLSGTLGAAGLGFIGGGILAGALGENSTGGSIGGGIGAGIGFMVGGPVGALIGGVGGAIFGGLFGPGAPTNATSNKSIVSATGALENTRELISKNPNETSVNFVQSSNQNFSDIAQAAARDLGIQYADGINFAANYSSKHGGGNIIVTNENTGFNTGVISYDASKQDSVQQAYLKALIGAAKGSGMTDTSKITQWYNDNYVNHTTQSGATNNPPSLPSNPTGSSDQSSWQAYLENYKAQQNANAAPVPATAS